VTTTPGWFGKFPSLGDFASRRLPPAFLSTWDDWLQRALAASREQLGEAWVQIYLDSPLWRFLLADGVIGEPAWCGVLMPSVDKVGRYFPLTVAAELASVEALLREPVESATWFEQVENATLTMLHPDRTVEQFESDLDAIPYPATGASPAPPATLGQSLDAQLRAAQGTHRPLLLATLESVPALLAETARMQLAGLIRCQTLWWTQPTPSSTPLLLCFRGLPAPEEFASMLRAAQLQSS
jgi:type VI secretion system protein ImpM